MNQTENLTVLTFKLFDLFNNLYLMSIYNKT